MSHMNESGKPVTNRPAICTRRRFLLLSAGVAAGMLTAPARAATDRQRPRTLSLANLHTGEKLACTYWTDGGYVAESLTDIDRLLRDHRTGEIHPIDPPLLDLLHHLNAKAGGRRAFEIISAYRSPKSNALLRTSGSGVAKKSLHMQGRAIDIRLPGCDLAVLRKAALALQGGGVGYYPASNFVHVDVGRVRQWRG